MKILYITNSKIPAEKIVSYLDHIRIIDNKKYNLQPL